MGTHSELDGFYAAPRARQIAMGQSSGSNTILTEINALQIAINTAATSGSLEVFVTDSTTMTSSADYFNAFNDVFNFDNASDKLYRLEMTAVVNYFSRIGYNISRERVGVLSQFQWRIEW